MGELRYKTSYTALLTHEQLAALRRLAAERGVSVQALIREGCDLVLAKRRRKRRRQ